MFLKILSFELRKAFLSKKNFAVLMAAILVPIGFFTYQNIMQSKDDTIYEITDTQTHIFNCASEAQNLYFMLENIENYPDYTDDQIKTAMENWNNAAQLYSVLSGYAQFPDLAEKMDAETAYLQALQYEWTAIHSGLPTTIVFDTIAIQEEITRLAYHVENAIPVQLSQYETDVFLFTYEFIGGMFAILLVLLIMLSCFDVFSEELEQGTFKFLLLTPISRAGIFTAKVISSLLVSFLCLMLSFATTIGISAVFGAKGYPLYPIMIPSLENGILINTPVPITQILQGFILSMFVVTVFIVLLTLFVSFALKETVNTFATMIALFGVYYLFYYHQFSYSAYLPFYSMNLKQFTENSLYPFPYLLWVVYSILIFVAGLLLFKKRDIK